jgi:multidrug efflux pump subunit AcrA (membrane-fusion protein)
MDYEWSSLLGSPTYGVVFQDCYVRLGDKVKAGQVLGRMRDWDIQADIQRLEAAASSDVEIRLNEAKYAQGLVKLKAAEGLRKRNAISALEHEISRLDAETARLWVEDAKFRRRMAQLEYEHAKSRSHTQEVVAPHDGKVVAILIKPGQQATNEPIFQVVDTRQILVTGFLDVVDIWRVQPGQPVQVSAEIGGADLAVEREIFSGHIVFVDKLVDLKSQTCKVTAKVENREDLLLAGLKARMVILPDETAGAREAVGLKAESGRFMTAPPLHLIDNTRLPDMADQADPNTGDRAQPAKGVAQIKPPPLIKPRR